MEKQSEPKNNVSPLKPVAQTIKESEMLILKWGQIRDPAFLDALEPIMKVFTGAKYTADFVLLGTKLKEQMALAQETFKKLLQHHGTPELNRPDGRTDFFTIPEENREAYAKAIEDFESRTFKLRIKKFDRDELAKYVQLAPDKLMALAPILSPLVEPAIEGEEKQESETPATNH
jgi:hypothetical protein